MAELRDTDRAWLAARIHAGHCGCDLDPDQSYFDAVDAIVNDPEVSCERIELSQGKDGLLHFNLDSPTYAQAVIRLPARPIGDG